MEYPGSFNQQGETMKILLTLCLSTLFITSCATTKTTKPSAAEQVAELQKMCSAAAEAMQARHDKKSLYKRLGERKKIKTFITNLYNAHLKNKQINHMFENVEKESFIGHATDFFVIGTGGKAKYTGRDMGSAHKHLKITNADFMSAGGDVQNTMKSMNYGEPEIQEVVCKLASFVPVVVVQ